MKLLTLAVISAVLVVPSFANAKVLANSPGIPASRELGKTVAYSPSNPFPRQLGKAIAYSPSNPFPRQLGKTS